MMHAKMDAVAVAMAADENRLAGPVASRPVRRLANRLAKAGFEGGQGPCTLCEAVARGTPCERRLIRNRLSRCPAAVGPRSEKSRAAFRSFFGDRDAFDATAIARGRPQPARFIDEAREVLALLDGHVAKIRPIFSDIAWTETNFFEKVDLYRVFEDNVTGGAFPDEEEGHVSDVSPPCVSRI